MDSDLINRLLPPKSKSEVTDSGHNSSDPVGAQIILYCAGFVIQFAKYTGVHQDEIRGVVQSWKSIVWLYDKTHPV